MLHIKEPFRLFKYVFPALLAGALAWLALMSLGATPLVRASGLALVVVGVALAVRRLGSAIALSAGMILSFSPAFWSQTGGGQGEPATIIIAVASALIAALSVIAIAQTRLRRFLPSPALALQIGMSVALVVFVALFISQIGTERSLRLTSLVVGWMSFLMIDMLLLANPHPDDSAPPILRNPDEKHLTYAQAARPYHTFGILLLFGVGVLNDPLLSLLAPAILLSLLLTYTRLSLGYWLIFAGISAFGVYSLIQTYLIGLPYFFAFDEWRNAERWLSLLNVIINQFSFIGIGLSVLGLARLARWYPPLGVSTMVAYAAYFAFGLVYIGPNRAVLLLPLFVLQIIWMSYAAFALSEWGLKTGGKPIQRLVWGAYALLPLSLLWQILSPTT